MHSPNRVDVRSYGWVLFGLCWLLWAAVAQGATQAAPILVFGDSLSAAYGIPQERSWVTLLRKRLDILAKPHPVINASVSGETTDGGMRRLPEVLERVRPKLVILELGGNDGLRGFPLPVIERNLQRLVTTIRDNGAQVILVGMRIPPNYGNRYAEGFHRLYGTIAERHELPLVPFMLEKVATDPTLMQEDRIHPRAEAQEQILDNIWPHLRPLL